MKAVFSDKFDYNKVEYVLICDGNYYEGIDEGGTGWVLIEQESRETVLEGYEKVNSNSTTESEYKSIKYGLKAVLKRNGNNILIKTDFGGIVSDIHNNRDKKMKSCIESLLSNLETWSIKTVNRSETERAHYLADHIMKRSNRK